MERTTYLSFWSNELLQIFFNLNWFVSYSEFQKALMWTVCGKSPMFLPRNERSVVGIAMHIPRLNLYRED